MSAASKAVQYGVNRDDHLVDFDEVRSLETRFTDCVLGFDDLIALMDELAPAPRSPAAPAKK